MSIEEKWHVLLRLLSFRVVFLIYSSPLQACNCKGKKPSFPYYQYYNMKFSQELTLEDKYWTYWPLSWCWAQRQMQFLVPFPLHLLWTWRLGTDCSADALLLLVKMQQVSYTFEPCFFLKIKTIAANTRYHLKMNEAFWRLNGTKKCPWNVSLSEGNLKQHSSFSPLAVAVYP